MVYNVRTYELKHKNTMKQNQKAYKAPAKSLPLQPSEKNIAGICSAL